MPLYTCGVGVVGRVHMCGVGRMHMFGVEDVGVRACVHVCVCMYTRACVSVCVCLSACVPVHSRELEHGVSVFFECMCVVKELCIESRWFA